MLSRIDSFNTLTSSDQDLIAQMLEKKKEIENQKVTLENAKIVLEEQKKEQAAIQVQYETLLEEQRKQIASTQDAIYDYGAASESLAAAIDKFNAEAYETKPSTARPAPPASNNTNSNNSNNTGNNNSNNGKVLRETLSETCTRRRDEGRNIIVGINTGFFNSHDGFPRGMHIEEGEPVFVNNPYVRSTLTNHVWGFTFFDNRSISFEKRDFTGKLKVGTKEYEYYSVNDTIVRLNGKPSYDANLYTFRYVKEPHPGLTNPIGTKALFIIGKNNQPLKVNSGDFEATITQIIDGRSTTVEAPYVIDKNEWVLQVTGDKANELAQSLKTGDKVQISAELKIGSSTDPIKVHNSSMYRYVYNGIYSAPPKKEDAETINPTTNLGMTQDKSKVIIFCVDGRTDNDRGLDFYEAYRVCKKLGLYDVIRFDGGGSTVMWTYENGIGNVINHVSDANGERSCMNYLHVRVLE